jgi:hypothetical protein
LQALLRLCIPWSQLEYTLQTIDCLVGLVNHLAEQIPGMCTPWVLPDYLKQQFLRL